MKILTRNSPWKCSAFYWVKHIKCKDVVPWKAHACRWKHISNGTIASSEISIWHTITLLRVYRSEATQLRWSFPYMLTQLSTHGGEVECVNVQPSLSCHKPFTVHQPGLSHVKMIILHFKFSPAANADPRTVRNAILSFPPLCKYWIQISHSMTDTLEFFYRMLKMGQARCLGAAKLKNSS